MKEKTKFWDKPGGKIALYVLCALSLALVVGAGNFGSEIVNRANDGHKAYQQNNEEHPKLDSLCKKYENDDRERKEFLEKVAIRDSFLVKTVERIERKLDRWELNTHK